MEQQRPAAFQFGAFQLDVPNGELRKHGIRIKLQEQPLQILVLLLEHPGEVVTREQIQHKLWAPDTYVDYDNAINSAMRKLREALGDDSEHPKFIETMARRGYRFVGHIETQHRVEEVSALGPLVPAATFASRRSRNGVIAAAVCGAAIFLAAAGWWLLRTRADTSPAALVPVPLTSAAGREYDPSFSPDGNQVAYAFDEGNGAGWHILLKLIGEGKPLQLTSGPKPDWCPAWSPNGRTIAFVRDLDDSRTILRRLYTVPALGGAERQVAEGRLGCLISWSPDGRFLALLEDHLPVSSWSLVLVRIENGDKLALTKPPDAKSEDHDPVFSPDGRALLFTRCTGDYYCGLYLLDLSKDYRPSGEPKLLRQERGHIAGSAWTANGREVVYALSEEAGLNHHLMRMRARAGAQPQRLTFAGEHVMEPTIARSGNRLLYAQYLVDASIWQVHPGEPPRRFISIASTRWEAAPQFSPDGQRVAFQSNRTGSMHVWVCDADGGNPVQLTHFESGYSGTPRWSPDGRWIAFDHQDQEGWRVYVMAADGGQVRRLAEERGDADIPSWSSDGKWIYYASNGTGRYEVFRRPAQGGPATQLTHNGGFVAFESRDGQSLYYSKMDSQFRWSLWVLPVGGGEEKQVLKSVFWRDFAPVDDGIYYMPETAADGSTSVRFRRFSTGEDTEIAEIKNPVTGLTVSPDRKTILFSLDVRTGSNIMVVDNFR